MSGRLGPGPGDTDAQLSHEAGIGALGPQGTQWSHCAQEAKERSWLWSLSVLFLRVLQGGKSG